MRKPKFGLVVELVLAPELVLPPKPADVEGVPKVKDESGAWVLVGLPKKPSDSPERNGLGILVLWSCFSQVKLLMPNENLTHTQ